MARSSGGFSGGGRSSQGSSSQKTQAAKIAEWATARVGSAEFHGRCQAFVYRAVAAGIGDHESAASAKAAREKWLKNGTSEDLSPPLGAAVYFNGTGSAGAKYGHVAVSIGGGFIIDPVDTVKKVKLGKNTDGGYLGWGWQGGIIPEGAGGGGLLAQALSLTDSVADMFSDGSSVNESGTGVYTGNEETTVEISTVVIKDESGEIGGKAASSISSLEGDSDLFLLIQGDDRIYKPLVVDEVKVTRERTGAPGKMVFSYADIEGMSVSEGNAVAFRYKNKKVFYGYIFTLESDSRRGEVKVTCYDQLRYFRNKDSFVYNKKYSDLLKYICDKYKLATGVIEDTVYKIPTRVEDGSLFDICAKASGFTLMSNGKHFVLYDDFGKICLKSIENMMLSVLIDKDTTGGWTLKESIDSDVYNRIVIKQDNSQTGERGLYIANDSETQSKWGVLSYTDTGDENSSAASLKSRAKALLKYHNRPKKTFNVSDCLGHVEVRGGSSVVAAFDLGGGDKIQNAMVVDKVEHRFSDGGHFMDLKLYGGAFNV